MRTLQVDDDVYCALESQVQGFGDTPNTVIRRLLNIPLTANGPVRKKVLKRPDTPRKRGKAPKTNLKDLVRVGSLAEGQRLFMQDSQGQRLEGVEAGIVGNNLEFEGEEISMSALAKRVMQSRGYQSSAYRGPKFWFTAEGKSVMELWDEYLKEFSNK